MSRKDLKMNNNSIRKHNPGLFVLNILHSVQQRPQSSKRLVDKQTTSRWDTAKFLKSSLTPLVSLCLLGICLLVQPADAATIHNFDNIPPTDENDLPADGGGWKYSSPSVNPQNFISNCGWYNTTFYASNPDIFDWITYFRNTYNSSHMGFETYAYFEIDADVAVKGNSLRIRVTGGKTEVDGTLTEAGLSLFHKKAYLDYLAADKNPIDSSMKVGHPYLYFMNNSGTPKVPFETSQGANRLSFYVRTPSEHTNGEGGWRVPPIKTMTIGPYTGQESSHWYHQYYFEGGGWTHVVVDGHPQHNNAWPNASYYPYPSNSLRDMGTNYFTTMYRWYLTFNPYPGIATPPYDIWIDEVEFVYDPEPQNNETIASPSISYKITTKVFQVSFNDKYKNNGNSWATYEMRYSFSPITNANWESATPVYIQEDSRYNITANTTGQFGKSTPWYQNVWASFKLSSTDENNLKPGVYVYFAIKDISQLNGDSKTPITPQQGRDYETYASTFDYAGDQPVLKLIKRINYLVPEKDVIPAPQIRIK